MSLIEKISQLNQIVRCPGIYLEKNKKENSYSCTIIPYIGSWVTIKIDLWIKK